MKKPPAELITIMKKHKIASDDLWDCHGTWVLKHRAVQLLAALEGVHVVPELVFHDLKERLAIFKCTATVNDVTVEAEVSTKGGPGDSEVQEKWQVTQGQGVRQYIMYGECAPYNCKNGYPIAMGQKRAEDRAILLALRLAGYVYSDVESDDFRKGAQTPTSTSTKGNGKRQSSGKVTMNGTVAGIKAALEG